MPAFKLHAKNGREEGFGILEIVIVVAIAAVVMAVSIIVFGRAKARYDLNQKAQNIAWQVERARSSAIKYNKTLTLGFSSQRKTFGLTCIDCAEAKKEVAAYTLPSDVTFSSYPTITIKGNGTVSSTSSTVTLTDTDGRQITLTMNNSGRVSIGDIYQE